MKRITLSALALSAALFMYSCGDNKTSEQNQTQTESKPDSAAQAQEKMEKEKQKTAEFIQKTSQESMQDLKLAQFVEKQAKSKEVKELVSMIVKDQKEINNQLKEFASKNNITLADSVQGDVEGMDKLKDKKGMELEKEYVKLVKDDKKEDANDLQNKKGDFEDADLKSWIDKTIPMLNMHAEKANKIDSVWSKKK